MFINLVISWFLFTFAYSVPESNSIEGVWLTGTKKGKVEIYKDHNKYFGKIVWLKNPYNKNGTPKLDVKNPLEKLRDRPILGMLILTNLVESKSSVYSDGKVYDPESGNTYRCTITQVAPNKLEIRGYMGISLIGRTEIWHRVK